MIYTDTVNKALRVAYECHAGQVDKAGTPYIFHPIHIAEQLYFEDEVLVGLLHDCLEDAPDKFMEFYKQLQETHPDVAEALEVLNNSGNKHTNYPDYINSVLKNRLARIVKFYDLKHNMTKSRFIGTGSKQSNDLGERYKKAFEALQGSNVSIIELNQQFSVDDYDTKHEVISYPYKISFSRARWRVNTGLTSTFIPVRVEVEPIGINEGLKGSYRRESVRCYRDKEDRQYDETKYSEVRFNNIVPNRTIIVQMRNCSTTADGDNFTIGTVIIKEQLI